MYVTIIAPINEKTPKVSIVTIIKSKPKPSGIKPILATSFGFRKPNKTPEITYNPKADKNNIDVNIDT